MTETAPFVVHERDFETIDGNGTRLWLIADASDCCGALGTNRLRLEAGAAGAKPHYHERSSEAFYVLEGSFEIVIDGEKFLIEKGGCVVVPPRARHSFSAASGCVADVLVTLVPGVDRFNYFRMLPKLMRGETDTQTLKEIQARYDVYLVDG